MAKPVIATKFSGQTAFMVGSVFLSSFRRILCGWGEGFCIAGTLIVRLCVMCDVNVHFPYITLPLLQTRTRTQSSSWTAPW